MTPSQIQKLEELDSQRKAANEQSGDLLAVRQWLRDGYKDSDKIECLYEMIQEKVEELNREADSIFDLILLRKKEYEKA
jgi:hypothetical protein